MQVEVTSGGLTAIQTREMFIELTKRNETVEIGNEVVRGKRKGKCKRRFKDWYKKR